MEIFFIYILAAAVILLTAALAFLYHKTSGILGGAERLLDAAFDGRLSEEHFNEQRLSKIESRLFRYLAMKEQAENRVTKEKNTVKELVSDISHQTRTPVANILLYTQLLKEMTAESENAEEGGVLAGREKEGREIVEQIETQTQKLNFLIQTLVKLSRLENGIVALHPVSNDVRALLAITEFEQAAAQKGIRLVVREPEESGITAVFDAKWTGEAVANIVENAIKYTLAGGSVVLSVIKYEMFVRIDIQDTGIGMTEEETARIFARFYRSPRVSREKGVGIGLYLAREILSRENGYIKVSSEPNKGSTFSVFLPGQANLSKL